MAQVAPVGYITGVRREAVKPLELKAILENHRLWCRSGGVEGTRAYLHGATFDLNFKQVGFFGLAVFSEDQIAWVCLHPKYPEWADSLKWVKAEKLSA